MRRLTVLVAPALLALVLLARFDRPPPRPVLVTAGSAPAEAASSGAYGDWTPALAEAAALGLRTAEQAWTAALPRDIPARTFSGRVTSPTPARTPPSSSRTGGGSHRGYATAEECVSMTENGGDYGRSSNPSHFGRYQFSRGAWAAGGGDPADWGTAPPAEQDRVFANLWNSPGGPGNWLPFDHC